MMVITIFNDQAEHQLDPKQIQIYLIKNHISFNSKINRDLLLRW